MASDPTSPPHASPVDHWRAAVRRHAAAAGVDLPHSTVDELAEHLEEVRAAALAEGATPEAADARAGAVLAEARFDDLKRAAERDPRRGVARANELEARARRRPRLSFWNAVRLAVRQLRQHPRFTLVTMLVLGLGTGAATAVFTIVDSVVLRPLPFDEPERLFNLWEANRERDIHHDPISPVNFVDYRALPVFADAAVWWRPAVNLVETGREPARVTTIEASANLFELLGVQPQLGAGFPKVATLNAPDQLGAVISDRFWRSRYGADPAIVGRQLDLNGERYTVLGVMPGGFDYPGEIDLWQLLNWDPAQHVRTARFMEAVARLAPGVTREQAQSACDATALRLERDFAASNRAWSVRLVPILDEILGYYRPALLLLFGAVGLLLAIGILNVASLVLTRALSRQRELGVRVALGASPRQLVTQLFAESLVLSSGGALVGVGVAWALVRLAVVASPVAVPRLAEASLDLRALGVCVGVVVASTVVFGLVPALLLLRRQVGAELRSGDRGSTRAARSVYSVLVSTEVALACALLVCSALLVRTVRKMTDTPLGIDAEAVLTATIQIPRAEPAESSERGELLASWHAVATTHEQILDAVRRRAGVIAAGASNFLPLQTGRRGPFAIDGEPLPSRPEEAPQVQLHSASDGYFEAMGARLAEGRLFAATDDPGRPGVVIVNRTFARRHFPAVGAVGRRLVLYLHAAGPLGLNLKADWTPGQKPRSEPFEIVGVVEDLRNAPLGQPVEPAVFFSTRQFPFAELKLAVRAVDTPTALEALRSALHEVAPAVPIGDPTSWGELFAARSAEPRLLMGTLALFGLLASLLAAIGIYGIFSWTVALRTRELAIRVVLGAAPRNVGRLVIGQTALLVALGLAAGLALVRAFDAAVARVLFEVSPHDAVSIAAASLLLFGAAFVACLAPARRVMRLDPAVVLQAE